MCGTLSITMACPARCLATLQMAATTQNAPPAHFCNVSMRRYSYSQLSLSARATHAPRPSTRVFKPRLMVAKAQAAAVAATPSQLVLQPIKRIEGEVTLPGSKSLSNRALLLAALAEGTTTLDNILVGYCEQQD